MKYNVYCDESCHLEHDGHNQMFLSCISCPTDKVPSINEDIKPCYQTLPQGVEKSLEVTRLAAGRYLVEFTLTVSATNLPAIPRVGLTFTLPSDYTQVAWQGLGPWENYSDRSAAACLGVYTATVGLVKGLADSTGTITYPIGRLNPDNYSEPGEQGYRTGCRWLELSNAVGSKEIGRAHV